MKMQKKRDRAKKPFKIAHIQTLTNCFDRYNGNSQNVIVGRASNVTSYPLLRMNLAANLIDN